MTISPRAFQLLVASQFPLIGLSIAASFLSEAYLAAPLREYERARADEDPTASDWIFVVLGVPVLIATIVSLVGLLAFWKPARLLYLLSMIGVVVLTPLGGASIYGPWELTIETVIIFLQGSLLALIFYSPISTHFDGLPGAAVDTPPVA